MLKINYLRMCKIRGIVNPYSFLMKNGFTHYMAHCLINEKSEKIKISQLYKLCCLLNCTPNDLFEYIPKKELPGHPINGLIKEKEVMNYLETIQKMTIPELKKIEDALKKIKEEKNDDTKTE